MSRTRHLVSTQANTTGLPWTVQQNLPGTQARTCLFIHTFQEHFRCPLSSTESLPAESGSSFWNLPWSHYQGDPNWIPPLRLNQKEMVGYKHHSLLRRRRGTDLSGLPGWQAVRPHHGDLEPRAQPLSARAARVLWVLRVDRRPAGGQCVCSTRCVPGSPSGRSWTCAGPRIRR